MGAPLGEGVYGLLRKIFVPKREEVTGGRRRLYNESQTSACNTDTTPTQPH